MPQAPEYFGAPSEGANKTGHPMCLHSKCSFFYGIFSRPPRRRICVATSNSVPRVGDPREGRGYVATFGLIPLSGTPENVRVM